jgi:hypothetical protein
MAVNNRRMICSSCGSKLVFPSVNDLLRSQSSIVSKFPALRSDLDLSRFSLFLDGKRFRILDGKMEMKCSCNWKRYPAATRPMASAPSETDTTLDGISATIFPWAAAGGDVVRDVTEAQRACPASSASLLCCSFLVATPFFRVPVRPFYTSRAFYFRTADLDI